MVHIRGTTDNLQGEYFPATMWVVGIKIGLTALSANTFPHRTIVLAL